MSTNVLLAIILAAVVVAVLALALIEIRRRLMKISGGLATLAGALEGVEAEHLRPLEPAVDGDQRPVRHHPRRAAGHRAQGRDRRRAEAAMTGVWIGAAICSSSSCSRSSSCCSRACSTRPRASCPTVDSIAATAEAGSKDLDAAALLLTTQEQVRQTIAGVAAYGGSLDVILDDAEPA